MGFQLPEKLFQIQRPMLRVCYALSPLVLASIYLFGWRTFFLIGVILVFGTATEAVFTLKQGKPITSAVFVTCLIFSLSLPPTIPFWMAVIGIVAGIAIGKMAFGGFGQNIFNPAMVGRCIIYINFPVALTGSWAKPMWGGAGGFGHWSFPVDAVTQATPLMELKKGLSFPIQDLFLGNIPGSLGETSAILIILGGAYIIFKRAAPWRLALSCLLGGVIFGSILYIMGTSSIHSPLSAMLSGSFLFGCAFVVTEPVSGAKTNVGQWIYGLMIGGLTMVLRGFSNFSEGIMFSVLIMNAFVPILDHIIRQVQTAK